MKERVDGIGARSVLEERGAHLEPYAGQLPSHWVFGELTYSCATVHVSLGHAD